MKMLTLAPIAALLGGCAFGTAHVDAKLPPNASLKGPLSQAAPTKFEIQPFKDARTDMQRIGYKKNGFGMNTADIVSTRPVTEVVVDAVSEGLRNNGHVVGVPADITVTGDVTRFWFELKPNMFTVEFTGYAECDLQLLSAKTGKAIYQSHYSGTYTEKSAGSLSPEGTATKVMDAALEKLVEDVVFDQQLVEALQAPR